MSKLDGNTYLTTYEDPDTLIEYDLRVHFDYQPKEEPEYSSYGAYPGCDEEVASNDVERRECAGKGDPEGKWIPWTGFTDIQQLDWEVEIQELINQQAKDNAEGDHQDNEAWEREL